MDTQQQTLNAIATLRPYMDDSVGIEVKKLAQEKVKELIESIEVLSVKA